MGYEKYKPSESPWVRCIPEHWNELRNGGIFIYHQDKVGDKFADYELLSLTTQGIRCKNIYDVSGKVPASYEGYQEVNIGDMVFCLFDLDCSAVFSGISNYHGMITSAYDVMKPCENLVNPKYLDYWFRLVFAGRYYKIFSKSVRYTINYDVFKALKTPVPPREEQDQIVRYLDWQLSKVNKLIHGYQKEIELLRQKLVSTSTQAAIHGINSDCKEKEAGIMGFDTIPLTWRILQNKRIFSERTEYSETGTEMLLSVSKHYGVKPCSLLTEEEQMATIKPAESLIGYKKVSPGDLAMNIMRARNGSYGISKYEGIVSPAYCVYKTIVPVDPRYMHYLLKTPQVTSLFEAYSYGICEHRRRLYAPDFLRLYMPLPPLAEQKEIADYIDELYGQIQYAIEKIQKQIDLLKEYRTRLISDVVTGQMDVRGIEIPDYDPEEEDISDLSDETEEEDETAGEEAEENE